MSLEGVGREAGAGRRGTAGAAGARVAGRTVQTDPCRPSAWAILREIVEECGRRRSGRRVRSELLG